MGRLRSPSPIASPTTGTFIQKIDCQPNQWTSRPPIGGPEAAAALAAMPIVPKAEPRRSGGMPSRTIAAPFGKESAPASACWVRKMISTEQVGGKGAAGRGDREPGQPEQVDAPPAVEIAEATADRLADSHRDQVDA